MVVDIYKLKSESFISCPNFGRLPLVVQRIGFSKVEVGQLQSAFGWHTHVVENFKVVNILGYMSHIQVSSRFMPYQVKAIFLDYQIYPSPLVPYFAKLIMHPSSSWDKTSEIPVAQSSSVISNCKYICDFDKTTKFS